MNRDTLIAAMGNTVISDEETAAFNQALIDADCTTINRAAMFAAQTGHECVGMRTYEEYASGSAYEGRTDLGNTQPGDGVRYKGRGIIQLTGRHNYGLFSQWAHSKGYVNSPTYFVDNPVEAGRLPWAFKAASWYWTVARPGINAMCDRGDLNGVTRAINGGLNGLDDRRDRWNRCLRLGAALLPTPTETRPVMEKVLNYDRTIVKQDTYYWCGPATVQNIINNRGINRSEPDLAQQLGTTVNGTDHIGLLQRVLNNLLPDAKYVTVQMPNDPPTSAQRDALWENIVRSINAGYGVAVNIVAPPSNYPRAVAPSTVPPAYSGGTVYHYVAAMGYSDNGGRRIWIADSGFAPYGYWISLDQLATLIPPKGYAYATGGTAVAPDELSTLIGDPTAMDMLKRIFFELTFQFASRVPNSKYRDTLVGYILNTNADAYETRRKVDDIDTRLAAIESKLDTLTKEN